MWKRQALLWTVVRGDARQLWFALRHPAAPKWLKVGAALIVLYVLSPIAQALPSSSVWLKDESHTWTRRCQRPANSLMALSLAVVYSTCGGAAVCDATNQGTSRRELANSGDSKVPRCEVRTRISFVRKGEPMAVLCIGIDLAEVVFAISGVG
jgi:hypothetical protein